MRINNAWVGYLDRTYQDIKDSIISRLRTYTPELTDLNESNILIILVSIYAGLTEQLNYYIDERAKESFLTTAQRYSSVLKLVNILDYRVKAAVPSYVDLYFTYYDDTNTPVPITEPGIVPQGTRVLTSDGMVWMTTRNLEVPIGTSFGRVSAQQVEAVADVNIGVTSNQPAQTYLIPGPYAHGSMEVRINDEPWVEVETLAQSIPTDRHFIVDVGEDEIPRIVFGNGQRGMIPPAGQMIVADYFLTEGEVGNLVQRGEINQLDSTLVIPEPADSVVVRNETLPAGGSDLESIEHIRVNAPQSIRVIGGAISRSDFNVVAQQVPGVAKATTVYQCGPDVDVYISPVGGGTVPQELLDEAQTYLEEVSPISIFPTVKAAGETPVVISLRVVPRFRVNRVDLTNEIVTALLDQFSFENTQINGRVAVSDILATVDNLARVDIVDLERLITLPYPTPVNHTARLIWERDTLLGSTSRVEWRLTYDGDEFRLFRGSTLVDIIPQNTVYTDPQNIISFRIMPSGMYEAGQSWSFVTYPANQNIWLDDNTVPVVASGTVIIEIVQ